MSGRAWLAVLLVAGLSLRLALSVLGGLPGDVHTFNAWMAVLTTEPAGDFYTLSGADHLPGDIAVLWAVSNLINWLDPGPLGPGQAEAALEAIAIACDLIAGAICFWIGERLRRGAGPLAAGLYLFNPGVLLGGTVWGQIDALSAMLALGAIALLLADRLVLSLPCLAWAIVIKPSFVVLVPLVLLTVRRDRLLGYARRLALGGALALALAAGLLLPFSTALGPIGSGDQLGTRVESAIDRTPVSNANAFNLWALAEGTPGSLAEPDPPYGPTAGFDDRDPAALGISSRDLGAALVLLALGAVYLRMGGRRDGVALVWAAMAAFVVLWLLPTRIHERYLFPAIAFGAPLVAVAGARLRALWAVLAAGWTLNLLWVYDLAHAGADLPLLDADPAQRLLALLMLVLGLAIILAGPPRRSPRPPDQPRKIRPRARQPRRDSISSA